jgi:hypothetical protein
MRLRIGDSPVAVAHRGATVVGEVGFPVASTKTLAVILWIPAWSATRTAVIRSASITWLSSRTFTPAWAQSSSSTRLGGLRVEHHGHRGEPDRRAVSSSATAPPVPITKVSAGADRVELGLCLLPTVVRQQHEPDHRRDGRAPPPPPAVIVQFDNGRGVGGSGRLLRAVTPDDRPGPGIITESWDTLDVHDGHRGVGDRPWVWLDGSQGECGGQSSLVRTDG